MPAPASPDHPQAHDGNPILLRVENLVTELSTGVGRNRSANRARIVDDVTFEIAAGRTFALVGESGCGKTTLARTILRLIPASSGRVLLDGVDLLQLPERELRARRRELQIIFQDPAGSLNPRMRVVELVGEAPRVHGMVRSGREQRRCVAELLARVGLPETALERYPHEFSGGQRQRIGIARALALRPKLIICDEPVSALDVSIQSQILNLLADLQRELGIAYLLIAHNLAVVQHVSDDVAVMRSGRIVEQGPTASVFGAPQHEYTRSLLAAAAEGALRENAE